MLHIAFFRAHEATYPRSLLVEDDGGGQLGPSGAQ